MTRMKVLLALLFMSCSSTQHAHETIATPKRSEPTVREGKWKVRDTRLFVRDVGPKDAPVLLVVHGGPGGNHMSLRPLEQLSPQYRVVLYDQRGTGESDRLDVSFENPASVKKLSLEENVEDIEAMRKMLGRAKISLIGHSWGAALAVFYAAAYPRNVEKLIVYSGGPETLELANRKRAAHNKRMTDEEKALFKERMKALRAIAKPGVTQEKLDEAFVRLAAVMFPSLYCRRPTSASAEKGRGGFWASQGAGAYVETFKYETIAPKLKAVTAPVLLTWGRCEPSPQERLTNLLEYLPNAKFVIFEKSGHNAMEEEKDLFSATIRAFLKGDTLPAKSYSSRAEIPKQPQ